MENLGYEKRDLLVEDVKDARKAQEAAKKQFESALDQFIAVINFEGGDLEKQYRKLKGEYEDCEARAKDVQKRIAEVEQVAGDLFTEWELGQYKSAEMPASVAGDEEPLPETDRLLKRAEKKLDPVLAAFNDRVLFLKHNLNARAITSLRTNRAAIEADIGALIADMNKSIAEADQFIQALSEEK